MYIRKIVSKNLGPIKKIQLLLPLENGVPKPVVLVGENGTGNLMLEGKTPFDEVDFKPFVPIFDILKKIYLDSDI